MNKIFLDNKKLLSWKKTDKREIIKIDRLNFIEIKIYIRRIFSRKLTA